MMRDDVYYCQVVVILIEGVLFRIPRFVLQDSEIFEVMFSVPVPKGTIVDGADDEHPLRLDGLHADDFRQFLRVVLPISTVARDPISWQQWISVLKLSTMWSFHAIRDRAIENLSKSDLQPVEKVLLSKRYDIKDWMLPALKDLARQEDSVSFEDLNRLSKTAGWEFPIKLGRVREAYSVPPGVKFCDLSWYCHHCKSIKHKMRCANHRKELSINLVSTEYVSWPCPTCTKYQCVHHDGHSYEKPAVPTVLPRIAFDFTSAIQREFGITVPQ